MIESHIRLFLLKAGMTTKRSCFIHGSWVLIMWSAISGVTVCQLTFFSRESSSSVDVVFSTVQYESEDTLFITKRWKKILLPGFLCLLKNSNVLGVPLISKTLHCWFFYVATTPSLRFFGLSLFSRGLHRHSWHRCRHFHPSNCLMYHIWMKMGILTSSLPMACLRIMVFHRFQDPSHLLCVFMDLLWLPPLQCIRHCASTFWFLRATRRPGVYSGPSYSSTLSWELSTSTKFPTAATSDWMYQHQIHTEWC